MNSRFTTVAAAVSASCLLVGCMANPGPPPVVEEGQPAAAPGDSFDPVQEPGTNPDGTPARTTIAVGVDPLASGLNPHLQANNSELVEQIADLVLPSAFVKGKLNTDLLDSVEELTPPPGVAQRVQYSISSAAQWSDGTPLTGADFEYLWRSIVSTAGVNSAAGYHAISGITTTGSGRVVTVDFATPVKQWQLLFAYLLPSHILQNEENGFIAGLDSGIPASAGRYLLNGVDTARGLITLNRNDRFWGAQPAKVDVLQLRAVRDTNQATAMMRSNQIGFADITPQQTSREALELVPGVQVENVQRPRQLRLHLSTEENALEDKVVRRQLASVVDTELIARMATGRIAALRVGTNPFRDVANGDDVPEDLTALRVRAEKTPIRIAVDPSDTQSLAAANTLVDVLMRQDIQAAVVQERMNAIVSTLLPTGAVDAVIAWDNTVVTSLRMADFFQCTAQKRATTEPPTSASQQAQSTDSAESSASQTTATTPSTEGTEQQSDDSVGAAAATAEDDPQQATTTTTEGDSAETTEPPSLPLAGDLSGFCPANAEQTLSGILAGTISPNDALEQVRGLNSEEVLYIPLFDETRVHALGKGIVGSGDRIEQWADSLSTAADWEIADPSTARNGSQ